MIAIIGTLQNCSLRRTTMRGVPFDLTVKHVTILVKFIEILS